LDLYEREIKEHVLVPDLYVRLDIPVALSVQRQIARATANVAVSGEIVSQMFGYLAEWHGAHGTDNLVVLDTNRSPDLVIADLLEIMGLEYEAF
ncbi:MAG: hypothetical protein JRJ84_16655, partial [Deltaproteobacteria bacterium]|nr:hypothetical protein [Deltaproteobacteria bacterium]